MFLVFLSSLLSPSVNQPLNISCHNSQMRSTKSRIICPKNSHCFLQRFHLAESPVLYEEEVRTSSLRIPVVCHSDVLLQPAKCLGCVSISCPVGMLEALPRVSAAAGHR